MLSLPGPGGKHSTWRNGSGAPANSLGVDNDFYLDTGTGNVYQRSSGTYTQVGSILGSAGATGTAGVAGINIGPYGALANKLVASSWKTETNTGRWAVAWSPELGLFCAIGQGGPASLGTNSNSTSLSRDGVNWYAGGTLTNNAPWAAITWSPKLRLFVATAQTQSGDNIDTSPDGVTWTGRGTIANPGLYTVVWSPELQLLMATGRGNFYTSPDAITWTARTTNTNSSFDVIAACWSPELAKFVAIEGGGSTAKVVTSGDGITWANPYTFPSTTPLFRSMTWAPWLKLFVAIGEDQSNPGNSKYIATSPDGSTWSTATLSSPASTRNWWSVAAAPELGLLVATKVHNTSTTTGEVLWSQDAVTWTISTNAPADSYWRSTTWASQLGRFVAVSGGGGSVFASASGRVNVYSGAKPDTINKSVSKSPDKAKADFIKKSSWFQSIFTPLNGWQSVAWSPQLGLFAAVKDSGGGSLLMTSPDGSKWTQQTEPTDTPWKDICWSPELRMFVAIGTAGATNCMTSTNGTTWTSRASFNNGNSVCWSPQLGIFVAVGSNIVSTSVDGITWITGTQAAINTWQSVCWSPDLGLFCTVSNAASGNKVMISPDGYTWTIAPVAEDNRWMSVVWADNLGLFVAVAQTGTHRVMTSPDGFTWTAQTAAAASTWWKLCWASEVGLLLALAWDTSGTVGMWSSDGVNWTTANGLIGAYSWRGACWAPELGKFCAVAYNATPAGGGYIMTSASVRPFSPLVSPIGTLSGCSCAQSAS